jgi:Bacterial toxin 23
LEGTEVGATVEFAIGWDGSRGWKGFQLSSAKLAASVELDLDDHLRMRIDAGYRLYYGGLGNSKDPDKFASLSGGGERDFWLSGSAIYGSGEAGDRPAYTGSLFERSAIADTFEHSFTFGQTLNWHSALGMTQIGHVEFADKDWYFHYNNDVNSAPSYGRFPFLGRAGTDHSWTAGAIIGIRQENDGWFETGYACFTGKKISDRAEDSIPYDNKSADGYYLQTERDLSFNRSEWFVREYSSGLSGMSTFSTPDWLKGQHKVHDASFPFIGPLGSPSSRRFVHDERRMSLSVGLGL